MYSSIPNTTWLGRAGRRRSSSGIIGQWSGPRSPVESTCVARRGGGGGRGEHPRRLRGGARSLHRDADLGRAVRAVGEHLQQTDGTGRRPWSTQIVCLVVPDGAVLRRDDERLA